jgi:hypothetical protein
MRPAPARRHCCAFCGAELADVELVFVSSLGGLPPGICSDCVEWFAVTLALHRRDPAAAARANAEHNAKIAGRAAA